MARDNSPKERQQKQLARKQERRASYDRILIVCRGQQDGTELFSRDSRYPSLAHRQRGSSA
jgi:hypothetical protein